VVRGIYASNETEDHAPTVLVRLTGSRYYPRAPPTPV
jgi:hypothetical protein